MSENDFMNGGRRVQPQTLWEKEKKMVVTGIVSFASFLTMFLAPPPTFQR